MPYPPYFLSTWPKNESFMDWKNDTRLAIEGQLAKARSKIRKAIVEKSFASSQKNGSFISAGTMYKNPFAFYQLSIQTI
ncbi:hypothetical protein L2E82_03265 [Cichorium intybus]|uniref:Uncharacterized protein n=1 Tax=Cichorium intybus TaxID=13427 RepID=A0ACB9H379_CICIN|nr:hypothetical protein L2E82_03265 [Cichorium intybus]